MQTVARLVRVLALVVLCACTTTPAPGNNYFERTIAPILLSRCTQGGGGVCHIPDGMGRAHGNVDLSSYESLMKRPDVVRRFGSYPHPLLLLKGAASTSSIGIGGVDNVPLSIRHAGGAILSPQGDDFFTLEMWLENGATLTGLSPDSSPPTDRGPCVTEIRTDLFAQGTLDAVDTASEAYGAFQSTVWPVLKDNCLGTECHGVRDTNKVPTIELYFTCGDADDQRRFNYLMARTYLGDGVRSQLTVKALRGGGYHSGGKFFDSPEDPRYQALAAWAQMDSPFALQGSEGQAFFSANVQPMLVSRGCFLEACHSLVNFNFYKPLAGTDGFMGTRTQLHNYLQARFMLGLESTDPAQGRLIKKNLVGGMPHKGGPLLGVINNCTLDAAQVRADPTRRWFEEVDMGCILATWHRLERTIAVETGQLEPDPGMVGVFVTRPSNPDRHIDFDNYRPGADLRAMSFSTDGQGRITGLLGPPTSLLGGCGVTLADVDARRPSISGDGSRVVFAMRASASEGLDLWQVNFDGTNCQRLGLAQEVDSNNFPIHHFDPVYSPGGTIVFASTRANPDHTDPARRYASRTPKWFLPNSNIWVFAPQGVPQPLSYLSGAEFAPSLLHSREVMYSVEKAAPDFYQISARALRFDDGGGYRPQLGQRPIMGYEQVTEIKELIDFRTASIASDAGTYFGGGTLIVEDLSLGIEELAYQDAGFMHPVTVIDPDAAAHPGQMGVGAYRSPTPLPDGRILVAYTPQMIDLGDPAQQVDYGLWVVDPQGREAPWQLYDTPGQFDIEPSVAYRRIYVPQPNRIHQGDPLRGEYVIHSVPLLAFLLNNSSRISTDPDQRVEAIRFWEPMPPPDGVTSAAEVAGSLQGPQQVYVERRLIGETPLLSDGSVRVQVPAKTPLVIELLDGAGGVLDWQREEEQIAAGETQPRVSQVEMFNAVCGGCHNALNGSELDVSVGPDVVTGASTRSEAARTAPVDLYVDPSMR